MNDEDREQVIRKYTERFEAHGMSPLTLGWTRGKQALRFRILLESVANLDRSLTILDFGCGFGDLYEYLQQHHPTWTYVGVDINARLVEAGRLKYPNARLEVIDDLGALKTLSFDYAVASGVFNSRITDNQRFLEECFNTFAQQASLGFAANFISTTAGIRTEDLFYWSAADVAAAAQALSKRFSINHAYMPFEFTLSVFVDDRFDTSRTVFPDYLKGLD